MHRARRLLVTRVKPMRHRFFIALLCLVGAVACRRAPAPETAPEAEPPLETRLHYATATQLFVEIPALVVGQPSKLAVHFTRLETWKPVSDGKVTVVLSGEGGEERFVGDGSSPGIYGPVVTPRIVGERRISIALAHSSASESHDLGTVRVLATAERPRSAEEGRAPDGGVRFLMEQQWHTDFATTPVNERPLRRSFGAYGVLRGRPEGDVTVRAPLAGVVVRGQTAFPRLGDSIAAGQVLAFLQPRFDATIDVATLERDRARAEASLEFARRERERTERLFASGLVSDRELQAAKRDEQLAHAEIDAAKRFRNEQVSNVAAAGGMALRAPLGGKLVEMSASPGGFSDKGAPLFRVADLARLWLELRIPESEMARAIDATAATFTVEGIEAPFEVGGADTPRVAMGTAIDPTTRTAPLVFEVDNSKGRVAIGTAVRARVFVGAAQTVLAVPVSAIVDADGQSVVYVQLDGESFERRVITPGARDGGFVAVTEGLRPNERVVSRGAYAIRLASASGSIPAHGHAH